MLKERNIGQNRTEKKQHKTANYWPGITALRAMKKAELAKYLAESVSHPSWNLVQVATLARTKLNQSS